MYVCYWQDWDEQDTLQIRFLGRAMLWYEEEENTFYVAYEKPPDTVRGDKLVVRKPLPGETAHLENWLGEIGVRHGIEDLLVSKSILRQAQGREPFQEPDDLRHFIERERRKRIWEK
jgi:hypothetical protein